MEDLQTALQGILSDPEQMQTIAAMAESLGLKPPEGLGASAHAAPSEAAGLPAGGHALGSLDLSKLMGSLSAMQGTEDRVFAALRPSLSPTGQGKTDRALRAAKLARLASRFLIRQRDGHV